MEAYRPKDMDKVLDGLRRCRDHNGCTGCPYDKLSHDAGCADFLLMDAEMLILDLNSNFYGEDNARKLREWLTRNNLSYWAAAPKLGAYWKTVRHWAQGESRMRADAVKRLDELIREDNHND